jgi:hypothetical protein
MYSAPFFAEIGATNLWFQVSELVPDSTQSFTVSWLIFDYHLQDLTCQLVQQQPSSGPTAPPLSHHFVTQMTLVRLSGNL